MTIKYHYDLEQGSGDWLDMRKGIITASNTGKILTPTLKTASNATSRAHFFQLLSERSNPLHEDNYEGWDMQRGKYEEILARNLYSETYQPVRECGFITNESFGFKMGCSPDGLVGDDGILEIKSAKPGIYTRHVMTSMIKGEAPPEHMLQIQSALLVSGRQWCDFIMYCGGHPMAKVTVEPNPVYHDAIIAAGVEIETLLLARKGEFEKFISNFPKTPPTEFTGDEITV